MSLMLKEILEQPQALRDTFQAERAHVLEFTKFARQQNFRMVVLVARGTSDNAARFGRYLTEITTGIPASLAAPSVHTLYRAKVDYRQALVVGISQSGEGTDINLVLEAAKRQGGYTVGITNEKDSPMAKMVDDVFLVHAGRQHSVAATKTYTGQLMLFYLLAAALGTSISLDSVSEIPDRVTETLKLIPELRDLVQRYRFMNHCVVVGRGINYGNAFELSLKLMETCYVIAERFSAADFVHGPIALIERDFPAFVFMPPGKTFNHMRELTKRLRALRAEVVAITGAKTGIASANRIIRIPGGTPEIYSPIPYIVPGQIFAALLAEIKGLDPDKPRSLNIVTQTV
ncbi:MAG: SIS domain-containing protein [Acidobacteriota bacterium]|nr:SIS domain-containing protein [Acidobacteriota bacterium]